VGGRVVKSGLTGSWLRTLLLQASFNYDRMIGVGFAFAIEPLLRGLPGGREGERYRAGMRRATQFFNAHPYMAGMAIGAVARAEFDEVPDETVRRLRHALVGPLGSIGDKLIWAGVLPVTVAVGLIVTASVSPLAGAVTFLVLYNAVHLVVRTWALRAGWKEGKEVSRALNAAGLQQSLRVVGPVAAVAVGFAIPVLGAWLARDYVWQAQMGMVLVAGLALVFSRWLLPTLGGLRYGLAAAAVALLVGWLW
jgi:PTS system mannose-specific IID component